MFVLRLRCHSDHFWLQVEPRFLPSCADWDLLRACCRLHLSSVPGLQDGFYSLCLEGPLESQAERSSHFDRGTAGIASCSKGQTMILGNAASIGVHLPLHWDLKDGGKQSKGCLRVVINCEIVCENRFSLIYKSWFFKAPLYYVAVSHIHAGFKYWHDKALCDKLFWILYLQIHVHCK